MATSLLINAWYPNRGDIKQKQESDLYEKSRRRQEMKPKHLSKLTETSRNDVFANNNAISDIVKSRRYYIQKTRTAGNPGRLTQAEQTNRLIQAGQPSRFTQDISSSEDELKEEEMAALPFKRIEYFTHNFRYIVIHGYNYNENLVFAE